jgi:hypothetical protein
LRCAPAEDGNMIIEWLWTTALIGLFMGLALLA